MGLLTFTYDDNDNIKTIEGCNVLQACEKPVIEFEISQEYNKQFKQQLKLY